MNPEIKKQWIAALRSGLYTQGIGQLHYRKESGSDFCCLGVLCDLAKQAGVVQEFENSDDTTSHGTSISYEVEAAPSGWRKTTYLPVPVVKWAGLSDPNPKIPGETLAGKNDNGYSFEEIATAIERNL